MNEILKYLETIEHKDCVNEWNEVYNRIIKCLLNKKDE